MKYHVTYYHTDVEIYDCIIEDYDDFPLIEEGLVWFNRTHPEGIHCTVSILEES